MKRMPWCLVLSALVVGFMLPTEPPVQALSEARQRWLRGNYEEARALYEKLAQAPATRAAAVIGLSRTWESQGEYDKALAAIETALVQDAKNADLLARRAEILYLRGRWEEAQRFAEAAIRYHPEHFLARFVRGSLARDRGDLKTAEAEFRWFVRTYTQRSENDDDIRDPDTLLLVGLAGCENARWNNLPDQFPFVLNEVYADAIKLDKDLWQAEYLAGALLLEKYNRGEALTAFDRALTINPRAAEPLVGKGVAALQKLELRTAEECAAQAIKINPNLPAARQLRADVALATGDVAAAVRELERARKTNPRDEATLGRLAACLLLQKKQAEFEQLVREVERYNSKPATFYYHLADQLESRKRFADAERFYQQAITLRPLVPDAQNALGMLYMRLGREEEAFKILTRAFEWDSYNVRVSNMLKVLRHLQRYETLRTEHFVIRFDPQHDRHLARYLAVYLEKLYDELAAKFDYRPAGPILFEIFTSHEKFSGRTIALPDLHTIGACTGRMFAMVSPKSKDLRKPFNWSRVVRHELVHIFNLEQTDFQVPHWFTEGLAVEEERLPRPQEWNQLLRRRVASGELLNLDTIDLGFMKPKSPEEWSLAYCQSQLYVQYLRQRFGPQSITQLLALFRELPDVGAALAQVCKVSKEEFEKGYLEYLKEVVRQMGGRIGPPPMPFSQLQRAWEQNPDDLDLSARLAEQMLVRKRTAEARKLSEAVLSRQKNHPLALYVRSRLQLAAGEEEEARKTLESALDRQNPEPRVVQALGSLYYEASDFTHAEEIYQLAHRTWPHESRWLVELLKVYGQTQDRTKQIEILKKLVPMDADDLTLRQRLARLLLEAGRHAEAELAAREVLEIDVTDASGNLILGDAVLALRRPQEAIEAYRVLVELDERSIPARLRLAQAYDKAGLKKEAEQELTTVLARDPNNAEARQLLADLIKK